MSSDGRSLWKGKHLEVYSRNTWEFVTRCDAQNVVAIIALTSQGEVVLVEQFRQPLGRNVLELPAGLVGDDPGSEAEAPIAAAQRELKEETGYVATHWTELFTGSTSAGLTDETIVLFLAENATKVGDGGGIDTEDITVHTVPLEAIDDWLEVRQRNGTLLDFKVMAGLYFAQRKRVWSSSKPDV